jgi:hypothetical protein
MLFDSRTMHTSKDQEFPGDYEDAFQVDGDQGLVAIADGVSSAIFSRQWADLLTRGVISSPPDLYAESSFKEWLVSLRQEWLAEIDIHHLPWNQRQKLQQVGGAYSTLLWLELYAVEDESQADQETFRMRCFAVGDCSLFHVRDNEILRTFPLSTAAEFDADPVSICSVDHNRDHHLEFTSLDDYCLAGDLLVLCTDAIGKWAMARVEAGDPPDWNAYWDMPHEVWLEEIIGLRTDRAMRYDDTTLVLLRIGVVESAEPGGEEMDGGATLDENDSTTASLTTETTEAEKLEVPESEAERESLPESEVVSTDDDVPQVAAEPDTVTTLNESDAASMPCSAESDADEPDTPESVLSETPTLATGDDCDQTNDGPGDAADDAGTSATKPESAT